MVYCWSGCAAQVRLRSSGFHMVFHLLSSRGGVGGLSSFMSRRLPVAWLAVAGPLLLASGPAHAFITISPWAVVGVLFVLAWPVVLLVLVGVLVWLRRRRPARLGLFRGLLAVSLLGSALCLALIGPEIVSSIESRLERRYWERVNESATPARLAELDRRLDERGPQAAQDYMTRLAHGLDELPQEAVLTHLFQRCADLMVPGSGSADPLLMEALLNGRATLVRQALAVPPCAGAMRPDREAYLAEHLLHMVSRWVGDFRGEMAYLRESETMEVQQPRTQALLVLLDRYPKLIDVELPEDECRFAPSSGLRCNALSEAFLGGHRLLTQALLPRDRRAAEHLPAMAVHLLSGRVDSAARAARQDPALLARLLPALFASASAEALGGLLHAVPLDAQAMLTADPLGGSDYDRLKLFHVTAFREREAKDWPLLWLLLDRVGPQLRVGEAEQLQPYVDGEALEDPPRQKLLARLKQAGQPCRVLRTVVRYHDPVRTGADFERLTGCEFKPVHEDHAPEATGSRP